VRYERDVEGARCMGHGRIGKGAALVTPEGIIGRPVLDGIRGAVVRASLRSLRP